MKLHWRLVMPLRSVQKALAVNASLLVAAPKRLYKCRGCIFATPFGANQVIIEGLQTELEEIVVDHTNLKMWIYPWAQQ